MNPIQAQAQLATLLSDTLQQVSADRLTQAVTQAFNDAYVSEKVYDNSLTYSQGTFEYTLPSTITTVEEVEIQRDSGTYPEPLDASLWSIVHVGGVKTLKFSNRGGWIFGGNYPIFLRGRYKYQTTDTIPASSVVLQNYVIALAAFLVLRQIGYTKVLSFLQNDTTMQELLAFRNQMQQDMLMYRAQLSTEYVDA